MESNQFREAMSRWASGVTVVACRYENRVIATTVSAFLSLSLEPPVILVALGNNATVLPFLTAGSRFGITVLSAQQRRLAAIFADPFPVAIADFTDDDAPIIDGAVVGLACTVRDTQPAGNHTLVFAAVDDVRFADAAPLIRFRRRYHELASS